MQRDLQGAAGPMKTRCTCHCSHWRQVSEGKPLVRLLTGVLQGNAGVELEAGVSAKVPAWAMTPAWFVDLDHATNPEAGVLKIAFSAKKFWLSICISHHLSLCDCAAIARKLLGKPVWLLSPRSHVEWGFWQSMARTRAGVYRRYRSH